MYVCTGRKPQVIKIHPVNRIGYNGRYVEISPEAIKRAVKWATEQINRQFKNDIQLGRGEDDDSYWGNGVVKEAYVEEFLKLGWAGYYIVLVTTYLSKE